MIKYILTASVLLSTIAFSADELAWVNTQIEAIKPPRKGMSNAEVASIQTPFIFLLKNKSEEMRKKIADDAEKAKNASTLAETATPGTHSTNSPRAFKRLYLSAIINDSALINGTWFKKGDKVYSYKLSSLTATTVILIKSGKKLILSTDNQNNNIKFK